MILGLLLVVLSMPFERFSVTEEVLICLVLGKPRNGCN